jgi:hypothetical protein
MRTDARGLFLPIVAPFAKGDYQTPIVRPEHASTVIPEMLDAAVEHFRGNPTISLPNIPTDDPSLEIIRNYIRARGMPYYEETEFAPRLRVDGRSYEAVEKSWKKNHRTDVRRQKKRLAQELGSVTLWEPSTLEEAEEALQEFFVVHDDKWLAQGYPGRFGSEKERAHFQSMMRRLWGKGLAFSTLRCGDLDLSYHFGFQSGGWVQWYRPSYRHEYHSFSPGKVHAALVIQKLCDEGLEGLDFLLGAESYKRLWTNEMSEVVSLCTSARMSPAFLWFSKGKPFLRERYGTQLLRAKAQVQKTKRLFAGM